MKDDLIGRIDDATRDAELTVMLERAMPGMLAAEPAPYEGSTPFVEHLYTSARRVPPGLHGGCDEVVAEEGTEDEHWTLECDHPSERVALPEGWTAASAPYPIGWPDLLDRRDLWRRTPASAGWSLPPALFVNVDPN